MLHVFIKKWREMPSSLIEFNQSLETTQISTLPVSSMREVFFLLVIHMSLPILIHLMKKFFVFIKLK